MAARIWRVTWTFLDSVSMIVIASSSHAPKSSFPDISGILLLKKGADLLQFVAACAGIVEQIAKLRRHGLDLLHRLLVFGIAFQHQHLVLGPALLLRAVNGIE